MYSDNVHTLHILMFINSVCVFLYSYLCEDQFEF